MSRLARIVLLAPLLGLSTCKGSVNEGSQSIQVTERISISSSGAEGNEASTSPSISADGRFVAFESRASNLSPDDADNLSDIFVRDRVAGTTTLVSRATGPAGAKGNAPSFKPSISADGSHVAFESLATNLDPDDADSLRDIYVRDLSAGTTLLASRMSKKPSSGLPGPKMVVNSAAPSISGNGRFVAFVLLSDDVPNNLNKGPYLRDTTLSTTIFPSPPGFPFNIADETGTVSLSADGKRVAVGATARTLFWEPENGVIESVSNASGFFGAIADQPATVVALSADGRQVAMQSAATNLIGLGLDSNGGTDIFIRDVATEVTSRASVANSGAEAAGISTAPSLSQEGRFVAFTSSAANLVGGDTNLTSDVFVRDRLLQTTVRVSIRTYGAEANGKSDRPAISADGRIVVFQSEATNMVEGDNNNVTGVFARGLLHQDPAPPSAPPTSIIARRGSGSQATVTWDSVPGATSYNLYRAMSPDLGRLTYAGLPGGAVQTGVTSPATVPGVGDAQGWYFVVTAVGPAGESVDSSLGWIHPEPWRKVLASREGSPLYGLSFAGATEGWTVGASGAIAHTVDAGIQWTEQSSGTTRDLYAVTFASAMVGWAVGAGGTILATTNGGTTWTPQNSTVTQDLFGVSFATASIGWAVGAGGTILRTSNGGALWSTQASGTTATLSGVVFASTTVGWAIGAGGTIIGTTNGGTNWTPRVSGTTQQLYGLTRSAAGALYAVGASGTILQSTDSGTTWVGQSSGTLEDLLAVAFESGTTGCASGRHGVITRTLNSGTLWTPQTTFSFDLNAIALPGGGIGVSVGDFFALRSITSGGSWSGFPVFSTFSRPSFVNATTGWVVGFPGLILSTSNAGTTWTRQTSGTANWLSDVSFVDTTSGWAVGDSNTILATANGGTLWSPQASNFSSSFNSIARVHFKSAVAGWATMGNQVSRFNGSTWTAQGLSTSNAISGLSFISSTQGWALGQGNTMSSPPTLHTTTNGGVNWSPAPLTLPPTSGGTRSLNSISFVSPTAGWAVGQEMILKFDGVGWTFQPFGGTTATTVSQKFLNDVVFVNSTTGWAIGEMGFIEGCIFHTTDGGATWNLQRTVILEQLRGISAVSATDVWVTGTFGVYHTTTGGN